ncbi:uncharacterized protein J8A68_004878 [[Candida] subhashii]|uniref:Uncharacterized protein n=1 Tax=[Candida] subhashii TaxID=561895 RepID=A0A8J5UUE4_9ASCO|nr:uncharacterized protein J8A68_004878 [[Candida] subhashii]KAG7661610.1 hypothetical protein J8A68_004878 [[Candida] subhashii]
MIVEEAVATNTYADLTITSAALALIKKPAPFLNNMLTSFGRLHPPRKSINSLASIDHDNQFTCTGLYQLSIILIRTGSNLSTRNLTNSGTWTYLS